MNNCSECVGSGHPDKVVVNNCIGQQSPDIAQGVDREGWGPDVGGWPLSIRAGGFCACGHMHHSNLSSTGCQSPPLPDTLVSLTEMTLVAPALTNPVTSNDIG